MITNKMLREQRDRLHDLQAERKAILHSFYKNISDVDACKVADEAILKNEQEQKIARNSYALLEQQRLDHRALRREKLSEQESSDHD